MRNYYFNKDGLRFSGEYLRMIKPNILTLGVYEQSEFVDMVTYENVKAGRQIINKYDSVSCSYTLNVTSIGNIAFVACYHPDIKQKELAKKLLVSIKNMFN